jgi:hypothetical protein
MGVLVLKASVMKGLAICLLPSGRLGCIFSMFSRYASFFIANIFCVFPGLLASTTMTLAGSTRPSMESITACGIWSSGLFPREEGDDCSKMADLLTLKADCIFGTFGPGVSNSCCLGVYKNRGRSNVLCLVCLTSASTNPSSPTMIKTRTLPFNHHVFLAVHTFLDEAKCLQHVGDVVESSHGGLLPSWIGVIVDSIR